MSVLSAHILCKLMISKQKLTKNCNPHAFLPHPESYTCSGAAFMTWDFLFKVIICIIKHLLIKETTGVWHYVELEWTSEKVGTERNYR